MVMGFQTLSNAIKHGHRELENHYSIITNSQDPETQARYQNQFVWELARHYVAEEIVVYPVIESIKGGSKVVDSNRSEHQNAKEQLYKFQSLKPEDAEFLPTLTRLFDDLKRHADVVETNHLVALENVLSDEESQALAKSFDRTKQFVPTRSHPMTPNKPPFETAVALLTAPMDKLLDAFASFPKNVPVT